VSPPETPTLCLIYGPPAVGKLTVAREVAARTSYRLVHNHVSIDPVLSILGWQDDGFFRAVGEVRTVLFDAAAREGVSIVATFAYAAGIDDASIARLAGTYTDRGGRACYVRLTAPMEVLLGRVADAGRREHGKITSVEDLRGFLDEYDFTRPIPNTAGPTIDTSLMGPVEAAHIVTQHLEERTP
jgi:hypothetical protein